MRSLWYLWWPEANNGLGRVIGAAGGLGSWKVLGDILTPNGLSIDILSLYSLVDLVR